MKCSWDLGAEEQVWESVTTGMRSCAVGQINQKPRRKYRATPSSVRSFARTAHLFACSTLFALLACSTALIHSLAPPYSLSSRAPLRLVVRSLVHFAHSLAHGTVNDWMAILCVFFSIFDHTVKQIQFCCSKILDRLSSSCFAD